jgi:hypothetical protein
MIIVELLHSNSSVDNNRSADGRVHYSSLLVILSKRNKNFVGENLHARPDLHLPDSQLFHFHMIRQECSI